MCFHMVTLNIIWDALSMSNCLRMAKKTLLLKLVSGYLKGLHALVKFPRWPMVIIMLII